MFLCEVKITPLCNTEDILDKVKNFSENLGIFFTDDKLSEVVKSINFDGEAIKQLLQTEAERVWGDPDFVKFVLILGPGTVKVFGVWFFFLVLTRVILFLLTKLIERLDISLSNHVHEENLYSVEHPAHIFCDIGMFFGETLVLLTQPSVE